MNGRSAAIAMLIGMACGGPSEQPAEPVVVRVAAIHGLSEFVPSERLAGATAYGGIDWYSS